MPRRLGAGSPSLVDIARRLLGLPPRPPRSLEDTYRGLVMHLAKLHALEQTLRSPVQQPPPVPYRSDNEVREWFEAERRSPGEGFRLWEDAYARFLGCLPETLRSELDPATNCTMREALKCRFVSFEKKPVTFLSDDDGDGGQPKPRFPNTDAATAWVQQRILPNLALDFARSLIPERNRGLTWEEVCRLAASDPKRYLPPNDLEPGSFANKVQARYGPIRTTVVRGLLATLNAQGLLPVQEISYLSPESGCTQKCPYYWPPVASQAAASGAGDGRRKRTRRRPKRIEPTPRQLQALKLHWQRFTFQQIGDELGITKQRAEQLVKEGLRNLKPSGRSVRAQALPTDSDGQVTTPGRTGKRVKKPIEGE